MIVDGTSLGWGDQGSRNSGKKRPETGGNNTVILKVKSEEDHEN